VPAEAEMHCSGYIATLWPKHIEAAANAIAAYDKAKG